MTKTIQRYERPSMLSDYHGLVAYDTETNGLHPDDGARVAVVSLAWIPDEITADDAPGGALDHAIATGEGVISVAYPFDQGKSGKPEDNGQIALFGEAENLDAREWTHLMRWLTQCKHGFGALTRTGVPYEGYDPYAWAHGHPECAWNRRLVMHNGKFDVTVSTAGTRQYGGVDLMRHLAWDTQVVQRELDPIELTGLKPTAERLWGAADRDEEKDLKAWLRKQRLPAGRYDLVPWDLMEGYAAKDTELTIRLAYHQIRRLAEGEGSVAWIRRAHQFTGALRRMEFKGLPYDADMSLAAAQTLMQRKRELQRALPFRPTDPAAKDYFFGERGTTNDKGVERLGLTPYTTTDLGNPQLTAEHLADMEERKIPHAALWRDWGKLDTALSMWYQGYPQAVGPDGRLRTVFRQTNVTSGRLSVERLNLQAIPHDYRLGDFTILEGVPTPRQCIASAFDQLAQQGRGWVAYEVDLAQAELRVAAVMAGCVRMLELIRAGEDLHGDGVRQMFGIDKTSPKWFPFRQAMKRGNFSLIFGVGWEKLRADIKKNTGLVMNATEARRFVDGWNDLYPEYQRKIDKDSRIAQFRGQIQLINGKFRSFKPIEDTHKAFNQRVQGSLAEFGLDWTLHTEEVLADWKVDDQAVQDGIGGAGLLLTVHDSQVLLLPRDQADAIVAEITKYASDEGTRLFGVPMGADFKTWGGKE